MSTPPPVQNPKAHLAQVGAALVANLDKVPYNCPNGHSYMGTNHPQGVYCPSCGEVSERVLSEAEVALDELRRLIDLQEDERDSLKSDLGVADTMLSEVTLRAQRDEEYIGQLRGALNRLLRWIDLSLPESLVNGRGNDEYFDVNFRASTIWNVRHAAEDVRRVVGDEN